MTEDYAEIRKVAHGAMPDTADFTLAITFTFSQPAVDRFKALIPWRERSWSAEDKRWYAHPRHLEAIKAFARDFDGAMFIDGERWEDLRTGRVWTQGTLFEGNVDA